jgi:hypothetical protein
LSMGEHAACKSPYSPDYIPQIVTDRNEETIGLN